MTTMNGVGHHNVEDILASIRTSIADETSSPRFNNYTSAQAQPARRDSGVSEDAAEFELPAIFKPGHQMAPDKPNLFGRLSDALKTQQSAEPDRSRTVIRFEQAAAARMIEPPRQLQMVQPAGRDYQNGPAFQPTFQNGPVPDPVSENDGVKREMPSFFDTRLNRIGEMTRRVNTPPVAAPKPAPAPAPVTFQAKSFIPAQASLPDYQPPMLPEATHAGHYNAAVDDTAAQLLRPLLRQWLTENMPKIVERALRSEAGGEGASSNEPPQDFRKTLR